MEYSAKWATLSMWRIPTRGMSDLESDERQKMKIIQSHVAAQFLKDNVIFVRFIDV